MHQDHDLGYHLHPEPSFALGYLHHPYLGPTVRKYSPT